MFSTCPGHLDGEGFHFLFVVSNARVCGKNFMNFNLRNGLLRKKSDSIKYAVKRFEEILYDLSLVPAGKKLDADAFAEEKSPKRSRVIEGDQGEDN